MAFPEASSISTMESTACGPAVDDGPLTCGVDQDMIADLHE